MILAALLVSTATLSFAGTAHADEENKIVNNPKEKTEVGINFKTNDGSQGTEGPFKGHLAVVFNPTRFNFGSGKVAAAGSNNLVFDQEGADATVQAEKQFLVVNDDREANGTTVNPGQEWNVKATFSGLKTSAGDSLVSTIKLKTGTAQNYKIGDEFNPVTQDYIPANPNLDGTVIENFANGEQTQFDGGAEIELTATQAVTVFGRKTADAGKKGGVATQLTDVQLLIPDGTGAAGKTFTGDITWALADTYQ